MQSPSTSSTADRLTWIETAPQGVVEDFASSVLEGLTSHPRWLSCRWLYDEEGSRLFEAICEQPEYYPTRAEFAILREHAVEIAAALPRGGDLVELGSGSALKTRVLIEALIARDGALRYVPVDISRTMLEASSRELLEEYPELEVLGVAAEYGAGLRELRRRVAGPKLVLWLGSNVGNFERPEAAAFLTELRAGLSADDRLLLGVDLRKDARVLERAYDDAAGVTAEFGLNLLARINRELGGDFDLDGFRHRARYDEREGRVEMHLVSLRDQRVRIDALDREFDFAEGETIHTENSYKYSVAEIDALAAAGGFEVESRWFDAERRFSLQALRPTS
ncbi:MAG TPA: L-histidine N(alpha)-methyltransferase [Planctomycetota bacterium]|nr:L-histidine N(alpha)-methyltransferase [Planctomycetota bacterium]